MENYKTKLRRRELNLTLRELAGSRVTPAQLSYVETDKCKPSLDLLEYISDRLGLGMDYLLESDANQVSEFCQYSITIVEIEIEATSQCGLGAPGAILHYHIEVAGEASRNGMQAQAAFPVAPDVSLVPDIPAHETEGYIAAQYGHYTCVEVKTTLPLACPADR